jgi:hypothetical protein
VSPALIVPLPDFETTMSGQLMVIEASSSSLPSLVVVTAAVLLMTPQSAAEELWGVILITLIVFGVGPIPRMDWWREVAAGLAGN